MARRRQNANFDPAKLDAFLNSLMKGEKTQSAPSKTREESKPAREEANKESAPKKRATKEAKEEREEGSRRDFAEMSESEFRSALGKGKSRSRSWDKSFEEDYDDGRAELSTFSLGEDVYEDEDDFDDYDDEDDSFDVDAFLDEEEGDIDEDDSFLMRRNPIFVPNWVWVSGAVALVGGLAWYLARKTQ